MDIVLNAGIPTERFVVAGFSQGACLATEFVGRNPRRYGALLAFTGGLIGSPGEALGLTGDLEGTPVLLSSGDPDPHVPWARVAQSADSLIAIGARMSLRRFPGRPHTILPEEIDMAQKLLLQI
jgi:phospholipase/carboxylesterase